MQHLSSRERTAPSTVVWLGYGGLAPFVALTLMLVLDPQRAPMWSDALAGYGAVILSFVGALHWGFAMTAAGLDGAQRTRAFVWSVVPALMAWPATVLPGPYASAILLPGFGLHLVEDHRQAGHAILPAWYLPLRWRLTIVAGICLVANVWYGVARA
ncbi:MAG: DUF3429 domain-containing protein [Burkholderiales bacterium]|nr:DUF3429 domain-containing protein [Burkholderiales bacterium]